MNVLSKSEQLKNELDDLRPLDAEAEARIMQKFRLDWNFHSNNLEGNSLTYGETKALILFGITAQGKPLKDHFEITGHNEAINWVLDVVKDKTPLTEKFIRELHTLLLKESSYKEAQTPDGKPTRRKIEVGKYKTQPNHVITVTGETFYFATPEETPAKMQELIEWFRKEKENPDINPIILAALFHYRFIRIHPFDDGNGRVARILMNFILMQFGYPPVIIKTEDKENYYAVLRLADADELEPFIEYIAQNLIRSLEIMIKGAKGEDIEEPDDLDKELALLESRIRKRVLKTKIYKSKQNILRVFNESLIPLVGDFERISSKFDKFYNNKYFRIWFEDDESTQSGSLTSMIEEAFKKVEEDTTKISLYYEYNQFNLPDFTKLPFEKQQLFHFNYHSEIYFVFGITKYIVKNRTEEVLYEKTYSENLNSTEIRTLINTESTLHKQAIENSIQLYEVIVKQFE